MAGAREDSEPLNKLLNSHPAGFYFYLNGVAQIRTVILVQSLAVNLFVLFINFPVVVRNFADAGLRNNVLPRRSKRLDFLIRKSCAVSRGGNRRDSRYLAVSKSASAQRALAAQCDLIFFFIRDLTG